MQCGMKKFLFMIMMSYLSQLTAFGQLNEYKYIVVPTKFETFKNDNQFRTSTLVKYLFTNEGFNTVYSNDLPEDLKENSCLGAYVKLINDSGLFKTKTRLSISDCNGVLLMTSQEGETRTKDLEQAYREAISESFGSFRGLNYKYEPKSNEEGSESITVSFKNDVKSLEEDITPTTDSAEQNVDSGADKIDQLQATELFPKTSEKNVLYAQPIEGGYQLVNTKPEVVYILKSTSAPDVFIVNKNGKNGVVFKNNGKWFIEMDEKGSKPKELDIKF